VKLGEALRSLTTGSHPEGGGSLRQSGSVTGLAVPRQAIRTCLRRGAHRRRDLVELDLVAQNERDVEHPRASPDGELNLGAGLFGAQALTLIRKPYPLGRLVAQALPQSWNCKIKEGTQLQRDLTLARVDNADRHRRWLIRLQQSD